MNTTLQPFGLNEAFWFGAEEDEHIKNPENELDDVLLKNDDAESTFDNEWLTTKVDFSSFCELFDPSLHFTTHNPDPPEDAVMEGIVEMGSSSESIASTVSPDGMSTSDVSPDGMSTSAVSPDGMSTSDVSPDGTSTSAVSPDGMSTSDVSPDGTSKSESMAQEDCPTSPEQYVPDCEALVTQDQQIKDIIAWVMSKGKLTLDQDQEDASIIDRSPVITPAGKKTIAACFESNFKGKTKTPEQKQRKKLQNRNAATRYRSKKRTEQDSLNSQCVELEVDNKKLSIKVESLQRETQYLKNLITDVFLKKTDQKNEQKKMKL